MRMFPLAIALGLICAASSAFPEEQDQNHSAHHPAQAAAPEAAQPSGHEHGDGKSSPVQENMKKIEALMQQIEQTADPAEKRELLAQHLEALREEMRLIRSQDSEIKLSMKEAGKKDGGTMGGMMKDGGMMGGGNDDAQESRAAHGDAGTAGAADDRTRGGRGCDRTTLIELGTLKAFLPSASSRCCGHRAADPHAGPVRANLAWECPGPCGMV